jgi:AcrR family transcriptional regulator
MEGTARQLRKAATRARVLGAALDLFARQGIAGTRTADIARAIGMSHGVIFLHFPTRDDLVMTAIDEFGRRLAVELRHAMEDGHTLRGVLEAHLRVLGEFEPFYARLVAEAALLPAKVRSTLLMLHAAVSHRLWLAAEAGHKAGTVRFIPRHLLFNTWIGLVHHYLVNRDLFSVGGSVIAEKKEELVRHFLSLVTIGEEIP